MESLRCSGCQAERGAKPTAKGTLRLPVGWKRQGDRTYCPACWRKNYVQRVVTIPVAGPVGWGWPELREALGQCWGNSTSLANWAITELAKADVVRSPGDERLPSMPQLYLYPAARERFPTMAPKSVVALLHAVEQRYRKARYAVIWLAAATLPRFRYPMPYPVHNQGWHARFADNRVPLIDVRLTGEPVTLRLRSGPQYRRQLKAFAQLVAGEAIQGELALYRQRASDGDHRPGLEDREAGGGQRIPYRLLAKMSLWLPRTGAIRDRKGTLAVRTAANAFLIAESGTRDPWVLNADHVVRWVTRHRRALDRMAQDTKYEKRWPKRVRLQMAEHRQATAQRHHQRIHSFCHHAAAMVVGQADRLAAAELHYDDTIKAYFAEFPWFRFRQMVAEKADERGIRFVAVGKDASEEVSDAREAA